MSFTKPVDPSPAYFFLIDCNQFFVSCELVFQPHLKSKPVVVLSNNDGCVISRSKQAKELGIPMGAPAYQCTQLFKTHHVRVFSANFALYGDMSQRVMRCLSHFSSEMEEYSIDEAFLKVTAQDPLALAQDIQQTVLQWTGVPVSIGIGPTKTLAKVANDLAKKSQGIYAFFNMEQIDTSLEALPVKEIWGIGRQLSASLEKAGIFNARAFKDAPDDWIKKRFSVALLRTAYELRGICCLPWNECPLPRQSITYARSFSQPVTQLCHLEEALADYTARAAEKLREEALLPSFLMVYLMTSRFLNHPYQNNWTITLDEPSVFTPYLVTQGKQALYKIFREGHAYKKVGIVMGGFISPKNYQPPLFAVDENRLKKQKQMMHVLDDLKQRYGNASLRFASEGIAQPWKMKRDHLSCQYTTSWKELLTIRI
jgi:DNA polymerase V